MKADDSKLRIALAVFDPPAALLAGTAPLLQDGIPLARIGLILLRSAVDRLAALRTDTAAAEGLIAALTSDLSAFASTPGGDQLMASPGLLKPWRTGWRLPALWSGTPGDGEPRLSPDLDRHVRAGAAIVAVESLSAREHWRCARVLLAQSSSSVLALECSLPATEADVSSLTPGASRPPPEAACDARPGCGRGS
jgi:hypothetical protein